MNVVFHILLGLSAVALTQTTIDYVNSKIYVLSCEIYDYELNQNYSTDYYYKSGKLDAYVDIRDKLND